jgi:hypothetical protein
LRLRGSVDRSSEELETVEEPPSPEATAEVRADADDELFDEDDELRGTAVPVREPSGGGVRTCSTGAGGGGGGGGGEYVSLELPPELVDEEPDELDDEPELDEPDEVEPRGTACAKATAGTATANVKRST